MISYSMMLLNLCVIFPNGERYCLNHKAHFHCFKLVTFPMTIKISFKFHYFHFKCVVSGSVACQSRLSCHVSCSKVYPTSGQLPKPQCPHYWTSSIIKREWLFSLDLIHTYLDNLAEFDSEAQLPISDASLPWVNPKIRGLSWRSWLSPT